jgi:hypothetical protein
MKSGPIIFNVCRRLLENTISNPSICEFNSNESRLFMGQPSDERCKNCAGKPKHASELCIVV